MSEMTAPASPAAAAAAASVDAATVDAALETKALETKALTASNSHQFCTFYLDHLLFGIESQKIQEVVTHRELRPVPLAPAVVSGLMNLRGQVVVALELRRQLELPERPANMTPVCLVVHSAGGTVSLIADEVGNVVEVEEKTYEPSPSTLSPRLRSVILGVHKLEGQLLHVLDTERVCEVQAGSNGQTMAG